MFNKKYKSSLQVLTITGPNVRNVRHDHDPCTHLPSVRHTAHVPGTSPVPEDSGRRDQESEGYVQHEGEIP